MLEISAAQIAELIHGRIIGDPHARATGISKIEEGTSETVSFLFNAKLKNHITNCKSSIVVISEQLLPDTTPNQQTWIIVPDAFQAFQRMLQLYEQSVKKSKQGIENPCFIHPQAFVGKEVYIGAFTYVDENSHIEDRVQIHPHCYIGRNVKIGRNTIIYSGVKIYPDTIIGENCIIHSGTVLGADGFGFMPTDNGYVKVPQLGKVVIENDVEIGANCTIDRATIGSTVIGKGTKLDNLIQIAHNVKLGEHNVFAAQVGIAGSTTVGNWNMLGGQVGIAGHLTVGNHNKIQAQSGIASNVDNHEELYGSPAQPAALFRRTYIYLKQLPELARKLDQLYKELKNKS